MTIFDLKSEAPIIRDILNYPVYLSPEHINCRIWVPADVKDKIDDRIIISDLITLSNRDARGVLIRFTNKAIPTEAAAFTGDIRTLSDASTFDSLTSLITGCRSARIKTFFNWTFVIIVITFLGQDTVSKRVMKFFHKSDVTVTSTVTISVRSTHWLRVQAV